MRRAFLYRLLRPIAVLLARLFHRRLRIENAGRVPREGPVVLAANHPNMLLDVILLAAAQKRTLHFLAKAPLFENRLLAWFLRSSGVLPVHRQSEGPGKMGRNLETFEACHRLLAEGGAIAIFPEGISHDREFVLPLRTGCARIVLEAEAKNGFSLGSRIVPASISFSSRELFRSDALVVFGQCIDPAPWFRSYASGAETDAVRALTGELEAALRGLALHVPREEDEEMLRTLRQFVAPERGPTLPGLEMDQALLRAVDDFRERHPIDYRRLRRRLLGYGRVLSVLGLTHDRLDRRYRLLPVLRYLLPRVLFAAAGLLPFLAGALFHYLPYKVPAWVARARAREPVERATLKLLTGLVTFPLFYLAAAFVVRSPWIFLPAPLGVFSLFYREIVGELLLEVRVFLLHTFPSRRVERLKKWRGELVSELEARRREYEAFLGLEKSIAE